MRLITILILLASPVILATGPANSQNSAETLYSVQLDNAGDGVATYRALRDKGYFAYAFLEDTDDAYRLGVAVGVFASPGAAAEFGVAFAAAESMDATVIEARVQVIPAAGQHAFVVTPNALWLRSGDQAREIYAAEIQHHERRSARPAEMLAEIAPNGRALALVYEPHLVTAMADGAADHRLLENGNPYVTENTEHPWRPGWSASGDHVAFLAHPGLSNPVGLWVLGAGKDTDPGCLACTYGNRRAVEWFVWHPSEERLLFIEDGPDGADRGRRLRSVDMDGTVTDIDAIAGGDSEEIAGPLRIENGRLHYRHVQWRDGDRKDAIVSEASISIDAL